MKILWNPEIIFICFFFILIYRLKNSNKITKESKMSKFKNAGLLNDELVSEYGILTLIWIYIQT